MSVESKARASSADSGTRVHRWGEHACIVGSVLLVVAFYIWTVLSNGQPLKVDSERESDYYNRLAHGFLDGHLYLPFEVPEALMNAENPYDPAKRPADIGLHDVSYYKGRYYLYFGVAPVVTLFLPFMLVTGCDLPSPWASVIFCSTGFIFSVCLWTGIRRHYFPGSSIPLCIVAVLALGLASLNLMVLRRSGLWELPIASGYAFVMMAAYCAFRGIHAPKGTRWWLFGGLALGLAVGSRPTYVLGIGLFAAPLLWLWFSGWRQSRWGWAGDRSWWARVLACGTAFSVVFMALLLYNYQRFGNLFEFGLNYQLTGNLESAVRHFSLTYVPTNFFVYYLAPIQWSRYFPFINVIDTPPLPAGYYGIEFVYGLLVNAPLVWFACLIPFAGRFLDRRNTSLFLATVLGLGALYVGIGGLMLFFGTAAGRYMVDFAPTLMLLACVGLLVWEKLLRCLALPWRVLGSCLWTGAAVLSLFFALMAGFQLHDQLRVLNPPVYAKVAKFFNHGTAWAEKISGTTYGPIEIVLRFPKKREGKVEPLLMTGRSYVSDHIYVYYWDKEHVQIGFDHTSRGVKLSRPIKIDFEDSHLLQVSMGSLYPPVHHPYFDGMSHVEVEARTRWLDVRLNGESVLQSPQQFYDGAPENTFVGINPGILTYGSRFSGEILNVRRVDSQGPIDLKGLQGSYALKVMFPSGATGRKQPLLCAGESGRGNVLYVYYQTPDEIVFGWDHWGVGAWQSAPVSIDPSKVYDVRIRVGSLYPVALSSDQRALTSSLIVTLDGAVVWARGVPFYPVRSETIQIGLNAIQSSTCEPSFTGLVTHIGRVFEGSELSGSAEVGTRIRAEVYFPSDRTGRSEPLYVSGISGAADFLFVTYIDESHVRFGHDHWGAGVVWSETVALDLAMPHVLDMEIAPGLEGQPGRLYLRVNGTVISDRRTPVHPFTSEQAILGRNEVGGSACEPLFTGSFVKIERLNDLR